MERILVDSSAHLALIDKKDRNHRSAVALIQKISRGDYAFVTTDYIIDETATLIMARLGKARAVEYTDGIPTPDLELVFVTDRDFYSAKEIFERYRDKDWSFTDCVSFALMKRLGITEAFTFDRHFVQAGFGQVK